MAKKVSWRQHGSGDKETASGRCRDARGPSASKVASGRVSEGVIRSDLIDRALDRLPRARGETRGKW